MRHTQRNIYDIKYGKVQLAYVNGKWTVAASDGGFTDVTGYTYNKIAGMDICMIVPQHDTDDFCKRLSQATDGNEVVFEASLLVSSGHIKQFLIEAYGTDGGVELLITKYDYVQKSGMPLEDINSMFSIMGAERVKEEINSFLKNCADKTKEHHLLLIDLDNYGKFLHSYGHQFIGTVINNILASVTRMFRNTDAVIGHISDDVIAVLIKDTTSEKSAEYANEICRMVERTYMGAEEYGVVASCKIGISRAFVDGSSFEELSAKAQEALDEAKTTRKEMELYSSKTRVSPKYKELKFNDFDKVISNDYERGFVAFASSLITHSRNRDCSINLLIECIGRNFKLDTVLIQEHISERKCMRLTNFWDSENGIRKTSGEESDYTEWENFMKGFDKNGFMFIENTENVPSENDKEWFKNAGVKSCVNCLLYDGAQILGYISFCSNDENKVWSKTMLDTLWELSKVVTLAVAVRMSEQVQMNLLERDDITGLLTYQAFIKKARHMLLNKGVNKRYAVVYADINNFAYVNDNFGFFEGNKLLYEVGERLNTIKGAIACRPGADRFLLVLPLSKQEQDITEVLKQKFEDIDTVFAKRFPMSDLSMIAGVCNMVSGVDDLMIAIENANATRKITKEDSREKIGIFTQEMREKRRRDMEIIGSVHKAIDDGEIIAYLQPKVSLKSRTVIGAEALARWKKDGKLISPCDFIPVLEKVGYIVDVDFCIYEQVLKMMVEWKDKGYELIPVSVNFSRRHLKQRDFEERVKSLAQSYGINSKYIEIEVTESVFVNDIMAAITALGKLREYGFKVDIDDFGTGYSSLNTLIETPADIVKIDKCFVDRTNTAEGRNYTKRIAEVALASKKDLVFEGVETEEQADFLFDNGYDTVQGFLFSRPIPIDEFEEKYMK